MAHKDLKELRSEQKKEHNRQTKILMEEAEGRHQSRSQRSEYQSNLHLRWYDWIIIVTLVAAGIGVSFLVGYLTLNSAKMPNWWGASWFAFAYLFVLILIWWILGYWKNKNAEKYYNDRRRRYQKTFTIEEAKCRRFRRLLALSWLPFALFTVLITIFL